MVEFITYTVMLCFLLLLTTYPSTSLPLCKDFRAPMIQKSPLTFCQYKGKTCCDSTKDLQLQKQFQAMNISDHDCASVVQSMLCATCDQFAAELFKVESGSRSVPVLCNSSDSRTNFCSNLWDTCKYTSIQNSPFAPSLQGSTQVPQNSTATKLTDLWQSKSDFCYAFGGNSSVCFNGKPVELVDNKLSLSPPQGLCLEKIGDGKYINMAPHPDGSKRAFFSNQAGTIWLANIPEQDSGETMGLDEENPFMDLSDQVLLDTTFGMFGMAFHPNFASNGRFFASYNCDKIKSPSCSGRCACNSDVNCDPSKLNSSDGVAPCQYHSLIAEYSANGTASDSSTGQGKSAKPIEVRQIFSMGLPTSFDHGGQIVFGPKDGNLYFMMGDGGKGDTFNFSQNKKSLLGKIMRLDIDSLPSSDDNEAHWGNYSIPPDNPYVDDVELEPEIWALGFRNPWRCSFDSERPSYFMCADIGQDRYEEVDVVTKGGNYGWNMFEGPLVFDKQQAPSGNNNTNSTIDDLIFPVVGYNHSDVNSLGSAAISGGFFYRSTTDPCTYGSYLYADLYAKYIWAALETPINSGNFSSSHIPFTCAADSPMVCPSVPNSPLPALQYIYSFGQDNKKDVFIMASSGVYRVVRPSRCNYSCSKEKATARNNSSPSTPSGTNPIYPHTELLLFTFLFLATFVL